MSVPHVRFSRDKRGYEHTFLVRRGSRGRGDSSMIFYWFRTPPDIRVGRRPLDEETVRALERTFPDLQFDWTRIRDTQAAQASEGRSAQISPEARSFERRLPRRRSAGRGRSGPHSAPRQPQVPPDTSASTSAEPDPPPSRPETS